MNEKLNTFRTLQDLPPAVTSFWCRFHIHTWTKWSAVEHNIQSGLGKIVSAFTATPLTKRAGK